MSFAIFDIESRVDKQLLARTLFRDQFAAGELTADECYKIHTTELELETGSSFVALPYHVPIAITVATVGRDCRLQAVDAMEAATELGLVVDFWKRAEGFNGCFVTFNGRGFDFPVLELAALRHGIPIPGQFAEKYGTRYRYQVDAHLDLQDFLTNNGAVRAKGYSLDVLLGLCGLPGKGDVRGDQVQELHDAGHLEEIRRYCTRDVAATYRLFLRVQVIRGVLEPRRIPELEQAAAEAFGGFD